MNSNKNTYLIIGKDNCPYCVDAIVQLDAQGIDYDYLDKNANPYVTNFLLSMSASQTFPIIFKYVGGSTDLTDQLTNDGYLV
jgi:glutaredoxin